MVESTCRHAVATIFELIDFINDKSKKSVTLGPCQWIQRNTCTPTVLPIEQIDLSLTSKVPAKSKPTARTLQ